MSQGVSIKGKVAVVTGASAGIGRAISIALAKAGVKVAICARRLEVLEQVAAEINKAGGEALAVQCDVTVREQVVNVVKKAEEKFGPVDILVNNAGVFYITFMKSMMEKEWEHTIDVNCKGVMFGIGAVLKQMIERRSGHIINISSDNGKIPDPGLCVYVGTKFFVEGMAAALRKEVSGFGVRVTNIQPGLVETPGIHLVCEPEATAKFIPPEDELKRLQTEDIANAVLYAASQPDHVSVNEVLIQPRGQMGIEK